MKKTSKSKSKPTSKIKLQSKKHPHPLPLLIIIGMLTVFLAFLALGLKIIYVGRELSITTFPAPGITWMKYQSEEYGFEIHYPSTWQIGVSKNGIHIYKLGSVFPENPTHETAFTNISIFPHGDPSGLVSGEAASTTVAFKESTKQAFDYVLENDRPWATYATFKNAPSSWSTSGFVWARVDVNDGTINEADRHMEEQILKTFKFIDTNKPVAIQTKTYTSTNYKFSLQYPNDFVVKEDYSYNLKPDVTFDGVSFSLPESELKGTNLTEAYISVEQNPDNSSCTGPEFLDQGNKPYFVTKNGIDYNVAEKIGAAAGNRYEEIVFATSQHGICYGVRYFIHSANIGNYEPGTVKEFDKMALLQEFDTIFASLRYTK